MTLTNPLAANPHQVAAIRATRLYVLIRDAYLATPQVTVGKLEALEELRRCTPPWSLQTLPDPGEPQAWQPGRQAAPGAGSDATPHTPRRPRAFGGFGDLRGSWGTRGGGPADGADGAFQPGEGVWAASRPTQPAVELTGVRLVEWLRGFMYESSTAMTAPDAALALLHVMTDAAPPRHAATSPAARRPDALDWSADLHALIIDAGAYLVPDLTIAALHRLARQHRMARRFLTAGSRLAVPARALSDAAQAPEDAVADMIGAVLGLRPESARAYAITLLDADALETTPGIAGGVVFERLSGCTGQEAFVGTRLARRAPADLIHHLATVECALRVRPGLRPGVSAALAALHEDVCSVVPGGGIEGARVRAGRRALELSVLRLGAGARGRIGTIAARRRLFRPHRWVEPAHGTA